MKRHAYLGIFAIFLSLVLAFGAAAQLTAPPGSFEVKNSAGNTVLFIDNLGNMELAGMIFDRAQTPDLQPDGGDFAVRSFESGTTRYMARVDDEGNLFLRSGMIEQANTVPDTDVYCGPQGAGFQPSFIVSFDPIESFVVRDDANNTLAWIDGDGYMVVGGEVTENADGLDPSGAAITPGHNVEIEIWSPCLGPGSPCENPFGFITTSGAVVDIFFDDDPLVRYPGFTLGGPNNPLVFTEKFKWGATKADVRATRLSGTTNLAVPGGSATENIITINMRFTGIAKGEPIGTKSNTDLKAVGPTYYIGPDYQVETLDIDVQPRCVSPASTDFFIASAYHCNAVFLCPD